MRIYAVADIHGNLDYIQKIFEVIEQWKPDVLVSAGDTFNYVIKDEPAARFNQIRIPFVGVRGNTDLKMFEQTLLLKTPLRLLDENPMLFDGITLVGISGTVVLPFFSRVSWFESRRFDRIAADITTNTILVSHPPPRGYNDRVLGRFRAGSPGLAKLIEKKTPMTVLCGHIHEQAGIDYFKTTPIINCAMNKKYSGAIIDCAKDSIRDIKLIPA